MIAFDTLPAMIRHHARTRGDAPALSFEGRVTRYAELDRRSDQVANGLLALGLKRGDHVVYLGKSLDHFFELLIGAERAGLVPTPVNWRLAVPEVAYIIRDCAAPVLFFGREFADGAATLARECPSLRLLVAMERPAVGVLEYSDWRDAQPATSPDIAVTGEDIAVLLYTSGTTGRPKGAMIRHRNLLDPIWAMKGTPGYEWNVWNADDISLLSMPIGHISGINWAVMTFFPGASAVVAREFNPGVVIDFIERDRVSRMALVPSALQFVLHDPRARTADFSRMKYVIYGGSIMPADVMRDAMEIIGCGFVQGYGMTETAGGISILGPDDHCLPPTPRMRSVGRPVPGVQVKIIDDQGRTQDIGQNGEICVLSAAIMAGYWNLPDETAQAIDAKGWLHTGDAGFIDEDGYLYIRDRIKDMIITGGENVYPAEVESVLREHPAVEDVAVIGLPDAKWGEVVVAVVVPRAGVDARDIVEQARKRIAGFKLPKRVEFIDALPRNAAGKVLKRALRETYSRA
jgi:long-chain acyl-CoA synthetase